MLLARLSIRWRITIGSLLIAALFSGLAAVVFRSQVEGILSSTTETLLEHDAAPIKTEISDGATSIARPGRAQLVSVVDPAGTVQRTTLPDDLAARLPELLRFHGEPREFTTGDGDYLILTQQLKSPEGTWSIVTARKLEASVLLLDRITETLLIGALALALGFGIASWLLTGAALRPVARMRRQASALSRSGSTLPLPVGPARDEISALATTLNEFIEQQRRASARERQMVSDASHELRSPIAVLKTQLELAHLSHGNAAALEAEISAAERSVERISALASDLLELSEVEATPGTALSTWSELSAELGSAADRARLAGARFGVTVDFVASEYGSASGDSGDSADLARYPLAVSRFGRILDNVCHNAINVMPEGGELQLSLEQHSTGCVLTVTDSGPGVPEEFIPVAFDRFSRPDHSRTVGAGGSGLGLAIVRAIVVDAGGTASLANREGGGLAVTVTIPRSVPRD